MTNKEKLIDTVNYLSEEQAQFIDKLINTVSNHIVGKDRLMELTYSKEQISKMDTAYPIGLMNIAKQNGIPFDSWNYVFDYNDNTSGQLKNISADLLIKVIETFKS